MDRDLLRRMLVSTMLIGFWCAASLGRAQETDSLKSCFPGRGEIAGWEQEDSLKTFHGRELYTLLDGGADVYLEYGCLEAAATRYTDAGGRTVAVELYRLKSSEEAYGLYTFLAASGGERINLGQEATRGEYYMFLWKGNCVLALTGLGSDSLTRSGIDLLARGIDARLGPSGERPGMVDRFFKSDFEHESVVYLRGRLGLANTVSFGQDRLFRPTEGVIGRRGVVQDLLLCYKSESEASLSLNNALSNAQAVKGMTALAPDPRMLVLSDSQGRVICAMRQGRYIAISSGKDEPTLRRNVKKMLQDVPTR